MRKGILTDTAYQRFIYKKLNQKSSQFPYHVWEKCVRFPAEDNTELVSSEIMLTGVREDICVYAAARALNAVAAEGGCPFGVRVSVLVPETADEPYLERMVKSLDIVAMEQGFEVLNVCVNVQPGCRENIVHVTAYGKSCGYGKGKEEGKAADYRGKDIVIVNPIALEGSLRILEERREELEERFIPVFLDRLLEEKHRLFALDIIKLAESFQPAYIKPVTDGGVFGALWELSETSGTGYEADMKKFPIRQETVEICEHFRLNPYQMASGGCILLVMDNGEGFVRLCQEKGAEAAVVGKMKAGRNKIIVNGEESRCTDRPAEDELFRMYKGGVHDEHEN